MKLSPYLSALLVPCMAFVTIAPSQASTTVNSNKVDVSLNGTIEESLSISVASPSVAFGDLTNGQLNTAGSDQTLSIVTNWNLDAGRTLTMYAYFDSDSAVLVGTGTGTNIPLSSVTGSVNGGSASSFSASSPFTSGSTALQMWSQSITGTNLSGNRTDTLALSVDLTSLTLPADSYAGTMHIQAQAL